jgi:hypothetical protein
MAKNGLIPPTRIFSAPNPATPPFRLHPLQTALQRRLCSQTSGNRPLGTESSLHDVGFPAPVFEEEWVFADGSVRRCRGPQNSVVAATSEALHPKAQTQRSLTAPF